MNIQENLNIASNLKRFPALVSFMRYCKDYFGGCKRGKKAVKDFIHKNKNRVYDTKWTTVWEYLCDWLSGQKYKVVKSCENTK